MAGFQLNSGLVVSLASCLATWYYTYTYVITTERSQEANIFNMLYTEYSQPQMLDSIDLVEDLRERVGAERYAYEYFSLKMNNTKEGKDLDHARRCVVRWYSKLQLLYKKQHIRWERYGDVLPGANAAQFFVDMFEPLMIVDRVGLNRQLSPVFEWYISQYGLRASGFRVNQSRVNAIGDETGIRRSKAAMPNDEL
mmetsp:Transcript_47236/g.102852  ORF Transcript_47236/g.102852 Transcript_47236/m.102852 type:complete len:196 (-) Transcript_47236:139-726(-)